MSYYNIYTYARSDGPRVTGNTKLSFPRTRTPFWLRLTRAFTKSFRRDDSISTVCKKIERILWNQNTLSGWLQCAYARNILTKFCQKESCVLHFLPTWCLNVGMLTRYMSKIPINSYKLNIQPLTDILTMTNK